MVMASTTPWPNRSAIGGGYGWPQSLRSNQGSSTAMGCPSVRIQLTLRRATRAESERAPGSITEENSMKRPMHLLFAVAAALTALPAVPSAHFKLLEPASWIKEDEKLGDPQKLGPC